MKPVSYKWENGEIMLISRQYTFKIIILYVHFRLKLLCLKLSENKNMTSAIKKQEMFVNTYAPSPLDIDYTMQKHLI